MFSFFISLQKIDIIEKISNYFKLTFNVSTALGFVSLCWMGIEAIRDLGVGLAVGIMAGAASTLLLLPALVQILRPRVRLRHVATLERVAIIGVRMARRPWHVIAATVVLLAIDHALLGGPGERARPPAPAPHPCAAV